ncbi:integrase, partial [Fervidicella metallireducens AeB]
MAVVIDRKNDELLVKFDYSPERIAKVKTIEGYRWNALQKTWIIPFNEDNLAALKCLYHNEQMKIVFEDNSEDSILIKRMEEELKLKGYSFKTRKSYLSHIKRFESYIIGKNIKDIAQQDIRNYILFLLDDEKSSHSFANQAISALKFLCSEVLKQGKIVETLPRPKRENKLPNVLSQEEVLRILKAVKNEKHKTLLFLIYSSGLRVGEVTRLKIEDIISSRMMIRVNQ